jgi:hypothetical protein
VPERRFAAVLLLALLGARTGLAAESPTLRLGVPIDCDMARDCYVQNYVDHDPGPAAKDQTCGPLTYDGHDGIDFRLRTVADMARGVAVLAAADGVVRSVRDSEPDISFRARDDAAIRGREAGNGVVLDHGGGWLTQYSHLRRGSIAVEPGQRVAAGTPLGLVGLSGRTEFPHLHFSVRHRGRTLDPFTGRMPGGGCPGAWRAADSLWTSAAREALAYRPGGPLDAGFATRSPELAAALAGAYATAPPRNAPALVFWAASWGLRAGDRETIRLIGPDGTVLAEADAEVPGDKAQWIRFASRRLHGDSWPSGRYRGEYRVLRGPATATVTVVDITRVIDIE